MLTGMTYAKSAKLSNFAYVKNLETNCRDEHALGSLLLDSDIFSAASADFSNIRIVDDSETEIPFLIKTAVSEPTTETNNIIDFSIMQDGSKTIVSFAAQYKPVAAIKIITTDPNFSRRVTVEGKTADGNFRTYLHTTCSYVSVGSTLQDNRTLSLPRAVRCSEWRITIQNEDNPKLEISSINITAPKYNLIFVRRPAAVYRIFYGGSAKPPNYDASAIINTAGSQTAANYNLSSQFDNEEYNKTARSLQIGGKAILTIAILLMVAVLGWGIATASKQIR
jgi:hypothetical protein